MSAATLYQLSHLKSWKNDIISCSIYFIWYQGNMIVLIVAWINASQLYRDNVAMRQPFAVYSAIFPAGIPPGPILSFSIIASLKSLSKHHKWLSLQRGRCWQRALYPEESVTSHDSIWRLLCPQFFQSWTRSAFGFGSLAMLKRWAHAKALLQWSGVGFKQRALRGGFMALGRYIEIVISYAVLEEKN